MSLFLILLKNTNRLKENVSLNVFKLYNFYPRTKTKLLIANISKYSLSGCIK